MGEVADGDRLPQGIACVRAANPGHLTLSGTNTYLVGTPAWVVDPGPDDAEHLERVWRAATGRGGVAGIVLTHRHLDHAGAVPRLRERSGAQVAVAAPRAGAPAPWDEPSAVGLDVDRVLGDGDRVGPFEAIATPGHSPDHLSFLAGTVLFCGDAVLGEGSVFIAPGAGSLRRYLDSLRRLRGLDLTALCPGHGPIVWKPRAKIAEYIEHRLDRERRLVEALKHGLRGTRELLDDAWSDVPGPLRPAAAVTLEAHLEKLEEEGALPEGVERLRLG